MFDTAQFQIIGRVGKVKTFDKVVRVSIATNASYKENGAWVDRTIWNEVAIFAQTTRRYVESNIIAGDYVRAVGTIRQHSYERGGDTIYTVELAAEEFSRQPRKGGSDAEHSGK